MGVTVRVLVREMPTRDLNLVRDGIQGEKRAKRCRVELTGIFPFRENLMARTKFADVMIPNVLPEGLELTTEELLGFLPVDGALTAWGRVPQKLGGALLTIAELGRHSR